MKVLTLLPRIVLQERVAKALCSAQSVVETAVSAKKSLQFARFAPYKGALVVVDVYISALRSKLHRDFPQKLIQTNRGVGYTFTCVGGRAAQERSAAWQGSV